MLQTERLLGLIVVDIPCTIGFSSHERTNVSISMRTIQRYKRHLAISNRYEPPATDKNAFKESVFLVAGAPDSYLPMAMTLLSQ
jgi:hypothetical protein